MTVTLVRSIFAQFGRFPAREIAPSVSVPAQFSSSREGVPMLHTCRGVLLAGTAALALMFAGARVARAQDAVIRGTINSDRGDSVAGANLVIEELRVGVASNASGRGQDPLYIVDGVIINGGLPDLNPSDIESVEVVKGAAGASLYGARAGNGVINITTKSARRSLEGVKFDIRSEAGVSDIERDFGLARYHALATDET